MPKQKHPFAVELEARVTVMAFDEASARVKVTKAFTNRELAADVEATEAVWLYDVSPVANGE